MHYQVVKKSIKSVALAFIIMMMSCKSGSDVLSKEKMTAILIDIHLAEVQMRKFYQMEFDSTQYIYSAFEKKIFEKHGTDSAQYYQSYAHYVDHLKDMNEIYISVSQYFANQDSLIKIKHPKLKSDTISLKRNLLPAEKNVLNQKFDQ